MSKRKDITGKIFNDILVLEFIGQENTHAKYKCLCMLCGKTFDVTYSNLISGNTKSCSSCGKKSLPNGTEQDIFLKFKQGAKISHLAKEYNVDRSVIYRIIRDFKTDNRKLK